MLAWLDSIPSVRIGGLAAREEEVLFSVRDAARLSDGRIVVANAGTSELRFFDADGAFMRAVGGEGEGPGEFKRLWLLHRFAGDSLVAYDRDLNRISVFDENGEFQRAVTLELLQESRGVGRAVALFQNGSLLAEGPPHVGGSTFDGLLRFPRDLYQYSLGGEFLRALGAFRGGEIYFVPLGEEVGFSSYQPIFPRMGYRAVVGSRFVYADNESFSLEFWNLDGSLDMIVRKTTTSRPVTGEAINAFVAMRLEDATSENQKAEFRRVYAEMPAPEHFPAHGAVEPGYEGRLWVEDYPVPGDEGGAWDVGAPGGVILGRVTLPESMLVLEIGESHLLVLAKDELGVEEVRLYGLHRTAALSN